MNKGEKKIVLSGKIEEEAADGIELHLGPIQKLPVTKLAISCNISPGGGFGTVTVHGGFLVGDKGHASITIALSENPLRDAFMATVEHATLSDIVLFAEKNILGLDLPDIPLLKEIEIKKLKMKYAPRGISIADIEEPPGILFDADVMINLFGGMEIKAYIEISPTVFMIDMSLSPFDLLGIIKVSSADGKGDAKLYCRVSKDEAKMYIDCKVTFLFVKIVTQIYIDAPKIFHFEFYFSTGFFGGILLKANSTPDFFEVRFELGNTEREKAKMKTIKMVKEKAKKMMDDAVALAKELEGAEAAYKKGKEELKENLAEAQSKFNEYCDLLDKDLAEEQESWEKTLKEVEVCV